MDTFFDAAGREARPVWRRRADPESHSASTHATRLHRCAEGGEHPFRDACPLEAGRFLRAQDLNFRCCGTPSQARAANRVSSKSLHDRSSAPVLRGSLN
jgi:hypothetical protein